MIIKKLYISLGHAYFGRHEKEPLDYEMIACDQLECIAGKGISGDRFFDYKPDYKGQITFFDWQMHLEICEKFQLPDLDSSAYRRNVLLDEINLDSLIGKKFRIGDCIFEGVEECRPCYWMDRACASGVEHYLKGKGGLRAKILCGGFLKIAS
jgi:MOSC domain-containing protein YiiM